MVWSGSCLLYTSITKIDWWFLDKMQHLADLEKGLAKCSGVLSLEQYQTAKKYGFQDKTIKRLAQVDVLLSLIHIWWATS